MHALPAASGLHHRPVSDFGKRRRLGHNAAMITVRRVVISLILAGAVALLGYGFNSARDAASKSLRP